MYFNQEHLLKVVLIAEKTGMFELSIFDIEMTRLRRRRDSQAQATHIVVRTPRIKIKDKFGR